MALAKNELIQTLWGLGENSSDFKITRFDAPDLLLEQRIVDAKYYGVASQEELTKIYRAKIWLDDAKKEAKYQEILTDQSSSVGILPTQKLEFEKSFIKGKVLFKKEKGVSFGFKKPFDPGSFGKVYDYSFDIEKVRGPIKQAIENAGWRFNQVITG